MSSTGFSNPWLPLVSLFSLWMFIDAVRRREWVWAFFHLRGLWVLGAVLLLCGLSRGSSATRGFELPGAHDRRRIKELEAKFITSISLTIISARRYLFSKGQAATGRKLLSRRAGTDPQDIDTRAHLGQSLVAPEKAGRSAPPPRKESSPKIRNTITATR